jgi:hypothetical protein
MLVIDFKKLSSLKSISKNFGVRLDHLEDFLNLKDNSIYYELIKIPKKNKKVNGYRIVFKAHFFLADLQKTILQAIENTIKGNQDEFIHRNAYGFVKHKSTYKNAEQHLNKKELLQVDIKSFFESIPIDGVVEAFKKLGCCEDIADKMANLCTVNNVLKEGLNTSPMLANLYFYDLDKKLSQLSEDFGCNYSRYADDITFSFDGDIRSLGLLEAVTEILNKEGLFLSKRKTRYSKYGQAQYVTGLSISNPISPRIPRKMKKQLRQELYYINRFGLDSHFEARNEELYYGHRRVTGWIVYALGVEPEFGKELRQMYEDRVK